ncbi:MAG: class I SAM-dependent methyltransferase [Nanoarchaeota archaeon]
MDSFDSIYSKPGIAPWTYKKIPSELVKIVKDKLIQKDSNILEIGCGEGHGAIFFAKKGYFVTAIDSSEKAIMIAENNALKENLHIDFKVMKWSDISSFKQKFDFIFDWRFLHEIIDGNERNSYLENIYSLLKSNGKYLSVHFSGDSSFMGSGKIRKSPVGINIYFSTLKESKALIGSIFKILESKHIIVPQKPNLKILANYVLAEK